MQCVTIIFLIPRLWDVLSFQLLMPIQGDARVYMTVGRGILNGLTYYLDMNDGRPPGMALLFSLSLLVSGDERFMQWLQVLVIVGIPCLITLFSFRLLRTHSRALRTMGILLACVFGIIFALYSADKSGRVQTESYGSFFAVCYLTVILWQQKRLSNAQVGLASVFMLLSYGCKEPFVLIMAACALLVLREKKTFVRGFLLPLGISVLLGCVIMASLGWLVPYMTIDIPNTLFYRIQGHIPYYALGSFNYFGGAPVWARGFLLEFLLYDVGQFSLPLSYTMIGIFFCLPFFLVQKEQKKTVLWLTIGVLLLVASLVIGKYAFIATNLNHEFSFLFTLAFAVSIFALCTWVYAFNHAKRGSMYSIVMAVLRMIATLYVMAFTVALGVYYYSNHLVFTVPVYIAIFSVLLKDGIGAQDGLTRRIAFFFIPLFILSAFAIPTLGMRLYIENQTVEDNHRMEEAIIAKQVDALLSACHISQYLTLGSNPTPLYSRTTHSPLGPDFTQSWSSGDKFVSPWLRKKYLENIDTALVIIDLPTSFDQLSPELLARVKKQYTTMAPSCAKSFRPVAPYRVMFRTPFIQH